MRKEAKTALITAGWKPTYVSDVIRTLKNPQEGRAMS